MQNRWADAGTAPDQLIARLPDPDFQYLPAAYAMGRMSRLSTPRVNGTDDGSAPRTTQLEHGSERSTLHQQHPS